jgi:maltose alpha-D-glucosyltransferase/alpha-amylase
MFLRNHDELTLEMVTDEERDYMYRAYAEDRTARINLGIRRRLAPLLRSDRRRIELMNALLFSLPGTPVIYYGDEIGMGDNIYLGDRNGVRTPMQWSPDRNAGFSRTNPQQLYLPVIIDPEYHFEAVNVEAQQNNPSSLLWWMKRLIALRKRYRAFGRGTLEFLQPANRKVLAFLRQYDEERILVVANLSRFVQHVELDLARFRGQGLEEMFGRSLFPPVADRPYPLTLGPHGFYWFALTAPKATLLSKPAVELPVLRIRERADELFENSTRDQLEALLPSYLQRRWPGGAPGIVTSAQIQDLVPFEVDGYRVWLLVVRLEFRSGIPETMILPLTVVPPEQAAHLLEPAALAGIALVRGPQVRSASRAGSEGPQEWVLVDALVVPGYCQALITRLVQGGTYRLAEGDVVLVPLPGLADLAAPAANEPGPVLARSERNNVTITFGTRLVYKSFRRMEEGISPDVEIGKLLVEKHLFTDLSPIVGHVEYRRRRRRGEPSTLAVVHRYVPNEGHAWQYTLDQLSRFFERVAALTPEQARTPQEAGGQAPLDVLPEVMGGYAGLARQLGQRTAELHRALMELGEGPNLAPEPVTRLYQRSLYQSSRNLTGQLCTRLERDRATFPEATRRAAEAVAARQQDLLDHFRAVLQVELTGQRIRVHGNYHLGELLYAGNRFILVDFEGEAGRPLGERRVKRSSLRDVACMVRSFDYAVSSVLTGLSSARGRPVGLIRAEDRPVLAAWGQAWVQRVVKEFVSAYVEAAPPGLLPETVEGRRVLLDVLLLEKALHEVDAELTFRPDWALLPLRAILRQLDGARYLNPWAT